MHLRRALLPLLSIILMAPAIVSAQGASDALSLSVSPENPAANSPISITLESQGLDLNTATVSWKVNGKEVQRGRGLDRLDAHTGALGTKLLVEAVVTSPSGNSSASDTIRTGDIDILTQADTYTPPLYLGKALWSHQSRINLFAIPHILGGNGAEIDPSTLVYRWVQDGNVVESVSGVGKRQLSWNDSVLSSETLVRVDVFLGDGTTLAGSASIDLAPQDIKVIAVEDSPLYGLVLHSAVGSTYALSGQEVSFAALPLYAAVNQRTSAAESYTWTTSSGAHAGNEVTYRIPDGGEGTSEVSLKAVNANTIFQPPQKSFLIQFAKPATNL